MMYFFGMELTCVFLKRWGQAPPLQLYSRTGDPGGRLVLHLPMQQTYRPYGAIILYPL
jgi:hypothetical protein